MYQAVMAYKGYNRHHEKDARYRVAAPLELQALAMLPRGLIGRIPFFVHRSQSL